MTTNVFVYWSDGLGGWAFEEHPPRELGIIITTTYSLSRHTGEGNTCSTCILKCSKLYRNKNFIVVFSFRCLDVLVNFGHFKKISSFIINARTGFSQRIDISFYFWIKETVRLTKSRVVHVKKEAWKNDFNNFR